MVAPPLDLISTSQKSAFSCIYRAPYVAVISGENATVKQSCCNHWDCPRCRYTLAAQHKRRMIEGSKLLMETQKLYFITITCRGKDLDLATADDDYLLWTNRLLSTMRARAKKQGLHWAYVQVTERQKRGAAHSHIISTFCPDDAVPGQTDKGKDCLISPWFVRANVSAGLGPQCVITEVQSAVAVAAYISGYLNKQVSEDVWPAHWKRIRYSQSWPKIAANHDWAIALQKRSDWDAADKQGRTFLAEDETVYGVARHHMGRIAPPPNN